MNEPTTIMTLNSSTLSLSNNSNHVNGKRQIPRFRPDEVELSKDLLGKGEFSNVFAVECILCKDEEEKEIGEGKMKTNELIQKMDPSASSNPQDQEDFDVLQESMAGDHILQSVANSKQGYFDVEESQNEDLEVSAKLENLTEEEKVARTYLVQHCQRNGEARYAVKCFKLDVYLQSMRTEKRKATKMLETETRILASYVHPCIIRLRGVCSLPPTDQNYFIILDKLQYTLRHKIYDDWMPRQFSLKGQGSCANGIFLKSFYRKLFKRKEIRMAKDDLKIERLMALVDIASALKFLHGHKILYRDLKPENVGFDIRGDLKIFDFGLSRSLPPVSESDENDLYQMTGRTGSRRYMAPEVTLGKRYNMTSDIYSFSILAWEIVTLHRPFLRMSVRQHEILVASAGFRPELKYAHGFPKTFMNGSKDSSYDIRAVLANSWDADISVRPTADQLWNAFNHELSRLINKNEKEVISEEKLMERDDFLMERSAMSDRARA